MNNDLISREQIRKMLNEAFGCENATKYSNKNAEQQALSYSTFMLYEIADIVENCCDNAPTIEPFEPDYVGAERLKARQRGYEEGYHNGMEMGKTLNPKIKQGEWQYVTHYARRYRVCPFCKSEKEDDRSAGWFYCWHCGAKMKDGKEE